MSTEQGTRYRPEVFDVTGMEHARQIILTAEQGTSSAERWEHETPFLCRDIGTSLQLAPQQLVLDYGCGIGRLSKALIEQYGCTVIGVDISASMRALALEYVASERFSVVSPELFRDLLEHGLEVDAAVSVWVLQHCIDVVADVALIKRALRPDGLLYVLNSYKQAIPVDAGWATAGIQVFDLLHREFSLQQERPLPDDVAPPHLVRSTCIAVLKKDTSAACSLQEEKFTQLAKFLDGLASDIYPEPSSELHADISGKAVQRLAELHPVNSSTLVLDVGCGQGPALELFRRLGATVVGVTLGEDDLVSCRAKGHNVVRMDQSFLEFESCRFDIVWARHVVEHSIFPLFTLAGFHRVLKPGGMLYLEVPAPDTDCHHERNRNHYSVLTRSSWHAHLARCGYLPVEELSYQFTVMAGRDEYWGFFCRKPVEVLP